MNDDTPAPGPAVVCFAVPDESRLFTAGLDRRRTIRDASRPTLPSISGEWRGRAVTVFHTGIGDTRAARESLAALLSRPDAAPRVVISAGYAGALRPGLAVGDLVVGENFSSPALTASARACLREFGVSFGGLVTERVAIETAAGKAALFASSGALAVDMETAWIAELCAERGLPMLSLRVISDAADQDFPVPGRILYDAVRQRPRYLALPAWLLWHPGRIGPFARFVRGLGPAQQRLTRALQTLLADL